MPSTKPKERAPRQHRGHRYGASPTCWRECRWKGGEAFRYRAETGRNHRGRRRRLRRTDGTLPAASFRYSPLGLRDGLLAQMAAEYDRSTRSGKQIESERWDSLRAAVAHYRVDFHHAMQVRESAMYLFNALKSMHRLPPEYREWLSAAALLYEVGDFVNRNGRHRHTHYIISHSEILGYTPEQRQVIAAIARYLGKSRPTAR